MCSVLYFVLCLMFYDVSHVVCVVPLSAHLKVWMDESHNNVSSASQAGCFTESSQLSLNEHLRIYMWIWAWSQQLYFNNTDHLVMAQYTDTSISTWHNHQGVRQSFHIWQKWAGAQWTIAHVTIIQPPCTSYEVHPCTHYWSSTSAAVLLQSEPWAWGTLVGCPGKLDTRESPLLWHNWMQLSRFGQRPLYSSPFCASRRSSLAYLLLGCSC